MSLRVVLQLGVVNAYAYDRFVWLFSTRQPVLVYVLDSHARDSVHAHSREEHELHDQL